MTYSLISNTIAGSTDGNGFTTSGIDTTGADLLIVAVADLTFYNTGTLSDSKGNTWSSLARKQSSSAECGLRFYYAKNPTVGSGHTFTFSQTFNYPSIAVQAWSGSHLTGPFDVENGTAPTSSPTAPQPGSITPGEDNELIVCALAWGAVENGSVSINSSMSITNQIDVSGGNHYGLALAWKAQTTAAAINPTWTSAVAQNKTAVIASFKIAAAAGQDTPELRRDRMQQLLAM